MSTIPEAVVDAAYDAACALGSPDDARVRGVVWAAVRETGWSVDDAEDLMGDVWPDATPNDLSAAKSAVRKLENPWGQWRTNDRTTDDEAVGREFRATLKQCRPEEANPKPVGGTRFDLDAAPTPPRWLIPDFVIRGKVHMISGGVHAYKTGLREAMMAASLTGTPFLGRPVPKLRWMIVDGENAADDVRATWKAAGLGNDVWDHVHYTGRDAGVRLGEPEWNDWLTAEAEAFKPDVIVLDTVARVCAGLDSMSQDSVVELYGKTLVPIVDRHDCALIFTAHHRKSGGKGDDAVNGSVQWGGQAEQTITVGTAGDLETAPQPDGTVKTHRPFVIYFPKGRTLSAATGTVEHFQVDGLLGSDGALLKRTTSALSRDPTVSEMLVGALHGGPLNGTQLAAAAGLSRTGDAYVKGRAAAVEDGVIVKNDDGKWALATD